MKTGIVILNYNNAADTIACLRSLYATTAADKVAAIEAFDAYMRVVTTRVANYSMTTLRWTTSPY